MIRINLLKPESKELKEATASPAAPTVKNRNPGNLVFLLLVIGLGTFYFFQRKSFDRENALLATARQERAQLQYVEAKLEEQRLVRESLNKKITLIEDLNAQRDIAARLMDELSRRLPEWVWLTEVFYDGKGIQIRGRALSNNLVADYISSLEASPQIMNVNLVSSTQRSEQGDLYLEFSLRATVVKPEPAPAPSANPPEKKGVRP